MTFLTMSTRELDQIGVFEQLQLGSITQSTAAVVLGMSIRQVRRKLNGYRKEGPASLMHAARGKPSNHQLAETVKEEAIRLVVAKYPDFGPTFAAEKLSTLDGIHIGKETLRGLMTTAGLWKPVPMRQGSVHVWRARRTCLGELVQLDGSYHHWFEDRADSCCLLAFIDDATSKILWAAFCSGETTENLFRVSTQYFESVGRPINLYVDRGGVYAVNQRNEEGTRVSQYERALTELSIGLIHARSPQAKGRVERLFGTLQDRLVKELRLAGISSITEANRFLIEVYLPQHNTAFAVAPKEPGDLHRSSEGYTLAHILCSKEERTLQPDWCLSYKCRWLQLAPKQSLILSKKERITVSELLDGSLRLTLRGTELSFTELPERPAKPLREKQPDLRHIGHIPSAAHPWRQYPVPTILTKTGHF